MRQILDNVYDQFICAPNDWVVRDAFAQIYKTLARSVTLLVSVGKEKDACKVYISHSFNYTQKNIMDRFKSDLIIKSKMVME